MDGDSAFDERTLPALIQHVTEACRVAGNPVPAVFAAYCLCTLTHENDHGAKEFLIDKDVPGPEVHNSEQQLLPKFAYAVRRAGGDVTPAEQPLVACLKLQALYEAAVVRETDLYTKAPGHGTGNAVADKVLATPFTAVRHEKLLLELYRNLNRFCYSQLLQESWAPSLCDEESLRREFRATFELVLPIKAVRSFLRFPREGRYKYLRELYHIVLGSCIVQTQAGKKLQFPDPRKLLSKDAPAVIGSLSAWIEEGNQRSQVLRDFWMREKTEASHADFSQDDLLLIAREQLFLLQALEYSKTLRDALQHCFKTMRAAVILCFPEIISAKKACAEQTPSREVALPIFAKVALHYRQAFCQRQRLDSLLRLAATLRSLLSSHNPSGLVEKVIVEHLQSVSPDISSKELPNNDTFPPEEDDAPLPDGTVHPSTNEPCSKVETSCELNGYCPWMLTQNDGALVPGDNKHGVVNIGDCKCVFSSIRAREECENKEAFLESLREQLLVTPPLIHFLKADHIFPRASLRRLLARTSCPGLLPSPRSGCFTTGDPRQDSIAGAASSLLLLKETYLVDKEVMTPVHFETIQRDNNYCWDEWKLRRLALQMASIMDRKTTHSQTCLSRCRTDQETQVYMLREQAQNTMKTTKTSAVRRKRYLTNLRGQKKTENYSLSIQVDL